jgi:hypothetical protein
MSNVVSAFYALGVLTLFVLTALFLGVKDALAQRVGHGRRGWAAGSAYNRHYDLGTLCKVNGEVIRVERFAPSHGMSRGVNLLVRTPNEIFSVHLGPAWFIDAEVGRFNSGDLVEVTGSRVRYRGETILMAAVVSKGDGGLRLRDDSGRPVWEWVATGSSPAANRDVAGSRLGQGRGMRRSQREAALSE